MPLTFMSAELSTKRLSKVAAVVLRNGGHHQRSDLHWYGVSDVH